MSEVRLTKARTFELDPNKKYLIQLKEDAFDESTINELNEQLYNLMGRNFLVLVVPKNQHLKIVEATPDNPEAKGEE